MGDRATPATGFEAPWSTSSRAAPASSAAPSSTSWPPRATTSSRSPGRPPRPTFPMGCASSRVTSPRRPRCARRWPGSTASTTSPAGTRSGTPTRRPPSGSTSRARGTCSSSSTSSTFPKAVYTSTVAVFSDTDGELPDERYRYDGPHLTVYDRTKWRAHYEVAAPMAEAGVPVVTVQPGLIYGPGDRGPGWTLWESYLTGNLPAIPSRGGYCWGHVEDTARAHRRAMERGTPGEDYIICGEPYELPEVMAIAEELTGITAPRTVPPAVFGALSRVASVVERVTTPPSTFRSETLRVLAGATYFGDNTKAERELGLEHRPFEAGLEETLAAARERLGV
ncbi:MAG: NAD-dependent epimerase/dehydratase family protein [Halobacteriales archaeon]|nr:NAD-dependent epimerase/dehydratase family protein [Halobacteriales archaeon]